MGDYDINLLTHEFHNQAEICADMYWYIFVMKQMEACSALLAICAGNSPATGKFPAQRRVTRSFDVFVDLCLNKWLSKQWWG